MSGPGGLRKAARIGTCLGYNYSRGKQMHICNSPNGGRGIITKKQSFRKKEKAGVHLREVLKKGNARMSVYVVGKDFHLAKTRGVRGEISRKNLPGFAGKASMRPVIHRSSHKLGKKEREERVVCLNREIIEREGKRLKW